MAREIPEVVRAAAGLTVIVLEEARRLPATLPGLPVRMIGLAMQKAMWLQQQYSGFVARGDELFTGILGEQEPGLATFDDDLPAEAPVAAPGFHDSAFDRVGDTLTDDDLAGLPEDAAAGPGVAVEDIAESFEDADGALEEVAIDQLVDDELAGLPAEPPPDEVVAAVEDITGQVEAAQVDDGQVDDGQVDDGQVDVATDEGGTTVAASTGHRTDVDKGDDGEDRNAIAAGAAVNAVGGESATPTDEPEGGSELAGSQAVGTAPIDGYDGFSIAQLRGHLRGYAEVTVEQLLAYEEATRAREPYLRMLRNRLERLQSDDED